MKSWIVIHRWYQSEISSNKMWFKDEPSGSWWAYKVLSFEGGHEWTYTYTNEVHVPLWWLNHRNFKVKYAQLWNNSMLNDLLRIFLGCMCVRTKKPKRTYLALYMERTSSTLWRLQGKQEDNVACQVVGLVKEYQSR